MTKTRQHNSVSEMVRALAGDKPFADQFDERISSRRLVKALCHLRVSAGFTQQELAEKMHCTQSKISKLESAWDAELRFEDVIGYAQACGQGLTILFHKEGLPLVDQLKHHVFVIQRLLNRLVDLAGSDGSLVKAVANFINEAAFNLTKFVQETTSSLPPLPGEPSPSLQVETEGV